MGLKEVFDSDDDVSRLPLMPDGMRQFTGDDGRLWAGEAELAILTQALESKWAEIMALSVPGWAGPALARAKLISEYRSMLEAFDAVTIADGMELAARGPLRCEVEDQWDEQPKIPEDVKKFSDLSGAVSLDYLEERWQVSTSDQALVRSNYLTELALMCRITTAKAGQRLMTAQCLRDLCPDTFAELSQGKITFKAASIIASRAQDLQPEQITELERQLLPVARRGTDDQVSTKSRRVRQKLLPETAQESRDKAEESRRITCRPEADGMANISWHLTAEDAQTVMNNVDAHAKAAFADDDRSMAQLRSDIMRDALIDGWPGKPGPGQKVKLVVTIPAVELLTDRGKGLAEIQGQGPIPLGVALKLAAKAPSFSRILTDPWDGAPMDVGRKHYRPSQALRDFLALRDGYCTFPGCRRTAQTSEVDHIDDWAKGGETNRANTRYLCKRHQMFRHVLGWTSTQRPDGSTVWRSPNGVVSESLPQSLVDGLCDSTDMSQLDYTPQRRPEVELTDDVRRVLALHDYGPRPRMQWFTPREKCNVVIAAPKHPPDSSGQAAATSRAEERT